MTFRRPLFALFLTLAVIAVSVRAQDAKPPSADEVRDLQKKYQEERAGALEKKFPEGTLQAADDLARRAAEALRAGNTEAAARFLREARWLVPYVPPDLPPHVDRVLGIARMRHGTAVTSIAFSPDGRRLASSSGNPSATHPEPGEVKIWDLGNGRVVRSYRGSKDPVRAVAWSRDGKWIASTAGADIHVWDPETGKLKVALKGHEKPVTALAFRPDGAVLASGGDDAAVRLWDVEKGAETANLTAELAKRPKEQINAVTFSPNGKLVAAVNGNGQLQVWNPSLEKGKRLVTGFDAHPGSAGAFQVVFGKDTSIIFSSGGDDKAKQWVGLGPDGESLPGHMRQTVIGEHKGYVTGLAVSRDGKFLATASGDKGIRLYDLANGARLARVYQGHTEDVSALAFSPDGKTLASGSADQSIRLWRVSLADEHQNFDEHKGYVWSAAFSPDGQLVASAGADRVIYVRDASGKVLHKLEGHTAPVTALAFSADSNRLASVGGDQVVRVWDARGGKPVKELKGHTAPVMAVAFGGNALLLTGGIDKVVRLWDAGRDEAVHAFPANKSMVSAVALRADGKQALVGAADGMLRVFDLAAAPRELAALTAHVSGVGAVAYGPDGTKVATCGGDGLVKHWNLADGKTPAPLAELKGHGKPVSSVAFSADGRFLVSGGGDVVVRVWDLSNKTELRALRGHADWVSSVAFGPDGRTILSAGVDRAVKVWELSSGETARPVGHTRRLTWISVSGDGRWVASASEDRTVKVWDTAAGVEAFTLDAAAGGHDAEVTAVAFDPSGKRLATGGEEKIIIWDVAARKPLHTLEVKQDVPYVLWSAKGDRFVAWQSTSGAREANNFKTYDPDGKPLNSLDLKDRKVVCAVFSADGEMAALGFEDGSVQVWNLKDNSRVGGDWAAFNAGLGDIGLTPDKKRVIASDAECNIKVYDIEAKKVVKEFRAHQGKLNGLMVGPRGNRFATMTDTGEVKVWKTDTGEELRSWSLPTEVRNLAFSADGKKLITANADTTLYVLNLP